MHSGIISILSLIFLMSCQGNNNRKSDVNSAQYALSLDTAFIPSDSSHLYFPHEAFKNSFYYEGYDRIHNERYSYFLFAMREPVMYVDQTQKEMYRLTWLRSFHEPVVIRIEKHDDAYRLYWKKSDGKGGFEPGNLIVDKQKDINDSIWNEFQFNLNQADFWNLKTIEKKSGTDGSHWIFEAKTPKQYHVVDRFTPKDDSKFYQYCDYLIRQTDLQIEKEDKY